MPRTVAQPLVVVPDEVAAALRGSVGLLVRSLRQGRSGDELTMPERSALSRLDRGGPHPASVLAKLEQISPQSMGATLARLQARHLIDRRPDPQDGRRVILSITPAGRSLLRDGRSLSTEQIAKALSADFSRSELKVLQSAAPLIERLALSL